MTDMKRYQSRPWLEKQNNKLTALKPQLSMTYSVCGRTDCFWLNCFTLPSVISHEKIKTTLRFPTHEKLPLYCLFIQIWNWNKHQLVRISSRWKFWGKLLSSFCQLSWKINDCLSRSMPGLPLCIRNTETTMGALAVITLRIVLLQDTATKYLCDFCWTAPRGPARREAKKAKVLTVVCSLHTYIQPSPW